MNVQVYMDYNSIPIDFEDFLIWLKEQTETYWAHHIVATLKDFRKARLGGRDWQKGTKWIGGYSTSEIDSFEELWNIKFPSDYRHFLQTLGAPDKLMFAAWYGDSIEMIHGEKPSFYDWRHGTETLNDAMTWPIDGILFDIEENDIWLNSWGVHPDTSEERRIRLLGLVHRAPALIPLTGLGLPLCHSD